MNGIQERVIRARSSSNLKSDEFDRDADVLMACAFAGEPGGAIFARLRGEFDEAHASVKREAPHEDAINTRLAAVMRLTSLTEAKAAARELSVSVARRCTIDIRLMDLHNVAWQALSVWLDPTCGHCGGRGFNGGYDGPVIPCRACRGSGKRRGNTGGSQDERLLIDSLAMEIEAAMGRFHRAADSRLRVR